MIDNDIITIHHIRIYIIFIVLFDISSNVPLVHIHDSIGTFKKKQSFTE